MANKKNAAASFDQALQASRKERNIKLAQEMLGTNPQKLAQEMLGKNRRTSTPRPGPAPTSLASRVGITKRSNSLPRSHTAPPRNPRQPSNLSRAPIRETRDDTFQPRTTFNVPDNAISDRKSNSYARDAEDANGGPGLNIRGAARGPWVVRAQNFAPGTTAADIESVMQNIGGNMHYCKLAAASPTVIAEMSFLEKDGADKVIDMFNNKKADGRMLYVYYVDGKGSALGGKAQNLPDAEEPLPAVVDVTGDVDMEVDDFAVARDQQNRQREERRGRDERGNGRPYRDAPRDDYYRGPARAEPEYQDGRYGFNNDRRHGGGAGGRYRGGGPGRMYSDSMRRGGGQSYRP